MAPFVCLLRSVIVSIFLFVALVLPGTAFAITAKDLTDGLSEEMGKGYITGMVDMLSYQAVLDGNREQAICINNAFYRDDATLKRVVDAMFEFPDKQPVQILIVVLNKACGS